jgi:uncharacterized membrane protein (UPF0127 family)
MNIFRVNRGAEKSKAETIRKVLIRNRDKGTIVADAAEVASTSAKRRKGLLSHEALLPGQGLWIVPCEAIHTFGMKFPIDIVYLDRKRRVRKTRVNMVPGRISMCLLAHSVLELPAGTIARTNTQTGDQLDFRFET